MFKKIFTDSTVIYITQICMVIGNFIFYYLLVQNLDDFSLGKYYSILSLITLLSLFSSSGLETFLMIEITNNKLSDKSYFILSLSFLLSSLSVIILPIYIFFVKKIVLNNLTLIFIILQPLFMLLTILNSAILQRAKKFYKFSLFRILMSFIKFIGFYFSLKVFPVLDAVLFINSLSYLIPNLIFLKNLLYSIDFKEIFKFSNYIKDFKKKILDLKDFISYYLVTLLTSSIMPGFIFLSSFLIEESIVGKISAINTFPQTIWILSSSIVFVFFPYMIEQKDNNKLFLRILQLIILIAIPSYIVLNFGLSDMLKILNLQFRFSDYNNILFLLSLYWITKLIIDLFQRFFLIKKSFKIIYKGYIYGYVISLIFIILLANLIEDYALPLSFILMYSILIIFFSSRYIKQLENTKNRRRILKLIIGFPIAYILSYFILDKFGGFPKISDVLLLQTIVSYSFYFIFGLVITIFFIFNFDDLKILIKKFKSRWINIIKHFRSREKIE